MSLDDLIASRKTALTVEEVAELLSVSKRLVYQLVSIGQIPHFRVGSAVRFEPGRLGMWLQGALNSWEKKKPRMGPHKHIGYMEDPALSAEGDQTAFWEKVLLG